MCSTHPSLVQNGKLEFFTLLQNNIFYAMLSNWNIMTCIVTKHSIQYTWDTIFYILSNNLERQQLKHQLLVHGKTNLTNFYIAAWLIFIDRFTYCIFNYLCLLVNYQQFRENTSINHALYISYVSIYTFSIFRYHFYGAWQLIDTCTDPDLERRVESMLCLHWRK